MPIWGYFLSALAIVGVLLALHAFVYFSMRPHERKTKSDFRYALVLIAVFLIFLWFFGPLPTPEMF